MTINYELYDLIYSGKDYISDIDYLEKSIAKYNKVGAIERVLEIGCGTANHTVLLAKIFPQIFSVDNDEKMLEIARKKVAFNNVHFYNSSDAISYNNFKLALSFFNVVNYLISEEILDKFFYDIQKKMQKGALFILDFYKEDCFGSEIKLHEVELIYNNKSIFRSTHTRFDKDQNLLFVTENYILPDNKIEIKNKYKIWTIFQIENFLRKNNFEIVEKIDKKMIDPNCKNQINLIARKI